MPIYENRRNAENIVNLHRGAVDSVVTGFDAVINVMSQAVEDCAARCRHTPVLAADGWYGVDWERILPALGKALSARGVNVEFFAAAEIFHSPEKIAAAKQEWITDDPAFGKVNATGSIAEFINAAAAEHLKAKLVAGQKNSGKNAMMVYGPGAMAQNLADVYDLRFYFDKTADPMLWKMWNGELVPFGSTQPRQDYGWKEYYYCDFYVLQRHKEQLIDTIDYYLEAIEPETLKIMPRQTLEQMLDAVSRQPIKQIKTYSPGPWGAYRYRDLWDIPGLENNAWNRLAGADMSILIQLAPDKIVNMPSANLLKHHAERFLGGYVNRTCPGLIPVEIWLDDGYFPTPQPAERTSMPIHNHPGTGYVGRHFNEPLGRYETYYIVEAYEGANTWMGFNDDANVEDWESLCRWSWENKKPIENWKDFIANWKTNVGDLFLIPEGTTHGHGGNQMVLEMDTCGNAAGGEYSFFGYDFMRPSWDDRTKTMTGKPMNMHLDRYFNIDKYCRAAWVKDHLRARPEIVKRTKEYVLDRYSTLPQMPFEIERLYFERRAEYTTQGKFLQAATLTIGTRVKIRSLTDPTRETEIEKFQCALIPAEFGDYEIVNQGEGVAQVVMWRLKQG